MGKMSEIDYEIRSASGLVGELRSYPQHYTAAHEAADRIEALAKAICDYAAAVVEMEGVTFEECIEDDASRKIVIEVLNARAALEGKDG